MSKAASSTVTDTVYKDPKGPRRRSPTRARQRPATVLCVDDDPALLEGLHASLGRDFDVTIALGAEDALGAMQVLGPPTVVITDMRMPGMDGATFLDRLRRIYPNTVRILLSGQADLADAARAVNEGKVFRFLAKPCPPGTLRMALNDAVELAAEQARAHTGHLQEINGLRIALRAEQAAGLRTLAAGIGREVDAIVPGLRSVLEALRDRAASSAPPSASTLRQLEQLSDAVTAEACRLYAISRRVVGESRERIDLGELVAATVALVQTCRLSPEVRLQLELPRQPLWVEGVRPQLEQALINVLQNAADAVNGLRGRQPAIRVRVREGAGAITVTVDDNGHGIAKDVLPRIFEPHFTTKAKDGALGLGLGVAKDVLEADGGAVLVESRHGEGTTVRMRLRPAFWRAGDAGPTAEN